MYERIVQRKDGKHFGTQITIYQSDENFLVVVDDRDGRSYYFMDLELSNLYPVDLHTKEINTAEMVLDCKFDIPLQKYGASRCPDWVLSLIGKMEDKACACTPDKCRCKGTNRRSWKK